MPSDPLALQRHNVAGVTRNTPHRFRREMPSQHGQKAAVAVAVAGAGYLALQDRQLVAEDGDLDVVGVRLPPQSQHPEHPSGDEEP
jgi:hypothetical protein